MPTVQIKTLELLIIRELRGMNRYNARAHAAFAQMRLHFSNEEYLHGIEHSKIIKKIYIDNFYKYRTAEALSQELHIDVKSLLLYRKYYLRFFAKSYLLLSVPTEADLALLYEALTSNRAEQLEQTEDPQGAWEPQGTQELQRVLEPQGTQELPRVREPQEMREPRYPEKELFPDIVFRR